MEPICTYSGIQEGSSKGFVIRGVNLFIVKHEGALYVYLNRCPHLGIPLECMPDQFLNSTGNYIICSNHGAEFQIKDGLCISGPCIQASLAPIAFEILNDKVLVDINTFSTPQK